MCIHIWNQRRFNVRHDLMETLRENEGPRRLVQSQGLTSQVIEPPHRVTVSEIPQQTTEPRVVEVSRRDPLPVPMIQSDSDSSE